MISAFLIEFSESEFCFQSRQLGKIIVNICSAADRALTACYDNISCIEFLY